MIYIMLRNIRPCCGFACCALSP